MVLFYLIVAFRHSNCNNYINISTYVDCKLECDSQSQLCCNSNCHYQCSGASLQYVPSVYIKHACKDLRMNR